jgi:hypothetical protein
VADEEQSQEEWAPHAEKEFGRFDRTLRQHAPRKLGELARIGRHMRGLVGAGRPRKGR